MATTIHRGNEVHTSGDLPKKGTLAPDFRLIDAELRTVSLSDFAGSKLVLNIFPSIDTSTCAQSVRTFNQKAAGLRNTKVLCISRDLPFAQKRFCGVEGIENVTVLSDFRDRNFGKAYGVELVDGTFEGLHARAIVVIDENGTVTHIELVPNISNEPNYDAALSAD
jgi:thiol peroxidase